MKDYSRRWARDDEAWYHTKRMAVRAFHFGVDVMPQWFADLLLSGRVEFKTVTKELEDGVLEEVRVGILFPHEDGVGITFEHGAWIVETPKPWLGTITEDEYLVVDEQLYRSLFDPKDVIAENLEAVASGKMRVDR